MNFFVNKFCWKLNGGPENFSGNFLHNSNNINLPRGSIWSSWNYHQSSVWSLVLKEPWGGQGLFFAGRGQLVFPRGEANIPGIAQWPENNLQIIHEDYKKWCWWCIGWSLCWCDLSEQLGRWRGATLYPLGCTTLAHLCTDNQTLVPTILSKAMYYFEI